jgi:hypothetical protein
MAETPKQATAESDHSARRRPVRERQKRPEPDASQVQVFYLGHKPTDRFVGARVLPMADRSWTVLLVWGKHAQSRGTQRTWGFSTYEHAISWFTGFASKMRAEGFEDNPPPTGFRKRLQS